MTSEIEIYSKDSIKLNILREVLSGAAKLSFQLNGDSGEDYAAQIHKDRSRVQIYGKFNISEDPNGELLAIRPIVIENTLKISFQLSAPLMGKTISVVRSATKTIEQEYEISRDISSLEFVPQGKQKYIMHLHYTEGAVPLKRSPVQKKTPETAQTSAPRPSAQESSRHLEAESSSGTLEEKDDISQVSSLHSSTDDGVQDDRFASFDFDDDAIVSPTSRAGQAVPQENKSEHINPVPAAPAGDLAISDHRHDSELQRIEQEIRVIERQHGQLSQKKQSAIDHLKKIEAEYQNDFESLEKDIEDFKSRMEADSSIIEYYKDRDVVPIKSIMQEIERKLTEAEAHIRIFIEAKQQKTMEIEDEIKSNKKQ